MPLRREWERSSVIALALAFVMPLSAARAGVILGAGHVDVGIGWKTGFDLHIHDGQNDVEYAPDEAILYAGENTTVPRPAGNQWDFIGAPEGADIWVLPQSELPEMLFLGLGAEEIKPGTFQTYNEDDPRVNASGEWIKLSLVGVNGPGEFSVWTTDALGTPVVWMSTADDGLDDVLFALAGGHTHLNWGFTAEGVYEIDVRASAFLPDGTPVVSDVATYTFGVNAVPEPGCLWLLAPGLFLRRR